MKHSLIATRAGIKLADGAWIATALLHREHPERPDFSVEEIVERVWAEKICEPSRTGVKTHVQYHCVAGRPPRDVQVRMLSETENGRRRLYREGDATHPERKGKIIPEADDIPDRYRYLLDWYRNEYAAPARDTWLRGIYEMIGTGKDIFKGVDPDEWVRQLREGWD